MKILRSLALGTLLLFFVAGCGEIPTTSPQVQVFPTALQQTLPSFPTPLVVEPTPYAPQEKLPSEFPPIVYAVKRLDEPPQIWKLYYEQGLLREELFANLAPTILESKINPQQSSMGYGWVSGLDLSPNQHYVAVTLRGEHAAAVLVVSDQGEMYTSSHEGLGPLFLDWAPNSERFVVTDLLETRWGTLSVDGTNFVEFPLEHVLEAVVLADGKRILFSKTPVDGLWLGTIDVNGGNLVGYLVPDPPPGRRMRNLALSPDGQLCAFTWDREVSPWGTGQVWIMGVDGKGQHALGPGDTYDFDLVWKPDQSGLAFVRQENAAARVDEYDAPSLVSSLWTIDAREGKEQLILSSESKYAIWSPQWLPDGSGLVFLSNRSGEANLWFIRADGIGLQQLTRQGNLTGRVAVGGQGK